MKRKLFIMAVVVTMVCVSCLFSSCEAGVLKVKHAMTVGLEDPGGIAALAMRDNIVQLSNGKMELQIFPGSQLGGMREHFEACQSGAIETIYCAASAASKFVPEVGVLDLSFLFPTDYDSAWEVIDGELTKLLGEKLAKQNFVLLGIAPYGYKYFHTGKKPIKSLEDLAGMKMRIMPSKTLELTYKAWGANPTPVEYSELYVALQQGIVDGGENGLSVIKTQKFNEVQDYLTVSKHGLFVGLLVANKKWFDKLSEDEKSIIIQVAKTNVEQQRQYVKEEDVKILEYLAQNGMTVCTLNNAEIEKLKKASAPVLEAFCSEAPGNRTVLDAVLKANEALVERQ